MKDSEKLFGDYELSFKGKVRDIYNINDNRLLIVTTDRISAFDYVFEDIIPGKGILLTKMTKFWFKLTNQIITNHLLEKNEIKSLNISNEVTDRCMLVKKTKVLPIEAIVRGYLAGSAWESYKKKNIINNEITNKIYKEYQKFDQAIFTPSTKANVGEKEDGDLQRELKLWVRKQIGPIATPDFIHFTPGLPKTRSGKIMRRILRKIAANEHNQLGDTTTLADPSVVESLVNNRKNI